MKAAVIKAYNEDWVVENVPEPKVAPGQVLIRIEASGLCGTDVHLHRGEMPFIKTPLIGGHEPVGKIVEVGAGVKRFSVGDRVGVSWVQKGCGHCHPCQSLRPYKCATGGESWTTLGGGNAELMVAWEDGCTLVPEGVGPQEAAAMFCAGYTVMSGLRATNPLPGEKVGILGVGGLGHLGLQLSKALGLTTVAITNSKDKTDACKKLGADEVVVIDSDVGSSIQKQAGGLDVIVSTTNSAKQFNEACQGLRSMGRIVCLGAMDGKVEISSMSLMFPQKQILGGTQGERRDLVDALELSRQGKVKPQMEVYPLEKVNEVRNRLEEGKVRFRAVLIP